MIIGIILAILLPAGVSVAFAILQQEKTKISKTMSVMNFTVMVPNVVLGIGAIEALTMLTVMLGFTFGSKELPHPVFYVSFGALLYMGIYLIVKTLTFKVVVKGQIITVHTAYRKPYTFTFSEISSAVRQVKNNQVKSERVVIRTTTGKKLIVERAEISYERFVKRISEEVPTERLVGFEL